jgi:CheY-like chemotaxis protein
VPERVRVLVVDDEPLARRNLRLLLGRDDEVEVVGERRDGPAAVRAIQDLAPDVVFLDVQMPEMDGFEATAAIRASERPLGRRTPIIALTASAMKGDRERCLAADMDDYVSKPIDVQELRAAMTRVRRRRAA